MDEEEGINWAYESILARKLFILVLMSKNINFKGKDGQQRRQPRRQWRQRQNQWGGHKNTFVDHFWK